MTRPRRAWGRYYRRQVYGRVGWVVAIAALLTVVGWALQPAPLVP